MRFNAVVLYTRKRLTGWDLNPRAQLINTPNIDIIYLLSKGTDMERKELLKNPIRYTFLTNLSATRCLCYPYLSSSPQVSAHNYHDCATLTLVYSIYDSTEEAI